MIHNELYKPGFLEVICGCMKSGKTAHLMNRLEPINYLPNVSCQIYKPPIDDRFSLNQIMDRAGRSYNCQNLEDTSILDKEDSHIVCIDEAQFFDETLLDKIIKLQKNKSNVVVAGLDLDFRGKPFGIMPYLLSMADQVTKLHAVCEYPGCPNIASRSQKMVDGKPAPYASDTMEIGDSIYQARCILHHEVNYD